VLALPAGSLADRLNRKHLMVACDGIRAAAMVTLALLALTSAVPYVLILLVAILDGAGFVVTWTTERGSLAQLVAREQVGEAIARNESRTFGAMLAGPPLGGILFSAGRGVPFLADALSYAVSAASKLLIRTPFQETRGQASPERAWEGLRWIWKRPFFRLCTLLFAAGNPIFTGLYLLVVVLAKRHGASSSLVGAMLGIAAAGGLLGALLAPALLRRLPPPSVVIGESWVLAAAIALMLLAHSAIVLGLLLGAAELMTPVTNSIVSGARVSLTPDRLQGRVQAAATLVSFSCGWLGPLAVGVLLSSAGATTTVLVLAGVALALAVWASAAPALRVIPSR
jgi:predicted MFS family arabinose efflux permease